MSQAKPTFHIIATATRLPNGREISMAYTAGLADKGHPELLVFGLPQSALGILNEVAADLQAGQLPLDTPLDTYANLPLIAQPVAAAVAKDYIYQANYKAGREVDALQLVWPDPAGRFPWESGADPKYAQYQPLLYQASH